MARAIRASASSAVIVHSENGFDSRKLDEGRMAHPPPGMPSALRVQSWPAQNCSLQKSDTGLTERPYQTTEMPKSFVQRRSKPEPALPSQRSSQVLRLFGLHERGVGTNVGSIPFPRDTTLKCDKSHRRG